MLLGASLAAWDGCLLAALWDPRGYSLADFVHHLVESMSLAIFNQLLAASGELYMGATRVLGDGIDGVHHPAGGFRSGGV